MFTYNGKEFWVNTADIDTNGTHLQGYINCSYDELVEVLGYPIEPEYLDTKTDAEWDIKFDDGTVATIYNWKNGKRYCGEHGLNLCDITQWHIGGRTADAVLRVKDAIPECQVV